MRNRASKYWLSSAGFCGWHGARRPHCGLTAIPSHGRGDSAGKKSATGGDQESSVRLGRAEGCVVSEPANVEGEA